MIKTLFLIFSSCIVVFSIISIYTAPIINGVLIDAKSWNTLNCKLEEDKYENIKDNDHTEQRDINLEAQKKVKNQCNREKAMYGLEYSSLIIDITLGFTWLVLGLLPFFDLAKPLEKISGIIGLLNGFIIFGITLVYICYSGYIFTNQIPDYQKIFKLDKEGAFAKKIGNKYICLYYKSSNKDSISAKYSDLGSSQYNYEKKRYYLEDNSKYSGCEVSYEIYKDCEEQAYINEASFMTTIPSKCDYLYLDTKANGFGNKYLFDM